MNIPVIKCDSAVVMPDANITTDAVEFGSPNEQYRYLSAFPLVEDGSFVPVASKDMKTWCICVCAYIDGEMVHVGHLAEQIANLANAESEGS